MDIPIKFDEEGVEEGEMGPLNDYDAAFEYPGGNEVSQYPPPTRVSSPSSPVASTTNRTTIFRLIAIRSTVLPQSKRLAVLDGQAEVSIGRDVTPSARIRLKEMAVSKFHASIYWDGARREWAIVDMGSMHGTFVRSALDAASSTSARPTPGARLSEPRKASMPRVLRHSDEVIIGGTTFLVHEHLTGRPCSACAVDGQIEIPLFASRSSTGSNTPSSDEPSRKRKHALVVEERDPKRAMAKLKTSLLSRRGPPSAISPSVATQYKDRSALRRELHPEPRVPSAPTTIRPELQLEPVPRPEIAPPLPLPPPPVSTSNIGHRLLLLQGWNPGTGLGEDPSTGLVEPLNLAPNAPRAGLGASVSASTPPSQQQPGDWREEAKRRRWDRENG